MKKLRVGDEVIVMKGRSRKHIGEILSFKGKDWVVVAGANVATKHQKQTREGEQSGRIQKELPIHISNVAIYNASKGAADRVVVDVVDDQKVRVFKSTGEQIEIN